MLQEIRYQNMSNDEQRRILILANRIENWETPKYRYDNNFSSGGSASSYSTGSDTGLISQSVAQQPVALAQPAADTSYAGSLASMTGGTQQAASYGSVNYPGISFTSSFKTWAVFRPQVPCVFFYSKYFAKIPPYLLLFHRKILSCVRAISPKVFFSF